MSIYFKLILTTIFWGGTFISGRILAGVLDPYQAAFLRYVVATVFLIVLCLRMEKRLPRLNASQAFWVICLGLTGIVAYNVLFFIGLKTVTAGRAALIVAANPALIGLGSALFFRERLSALQVLGILLSLTGTMVIISNGDLPVLFSGGIGLGELAIFGCVASWVAYSLLGKIAMRTLTPLSAVTASCIIGTLVLGCLAVFASPFDPSTMLMGPSITHWGHLFFLGIFGTGLGFCWYYQAIQSIGPSRAGIFINLVPVAAVGLGFLLLGESVTLPMLLGAVLVLGGIYLTNKKRNH